MIITKGIKAKLQPNLAQEKWLDQQFGNVRFVWNYYLGLPKKQYQVARIYKLSKKIVPKPLRFPRKDDLYNSLKSLKQKYTWLKYSDSRSLQCELGTLYQTYQHLFKGLCGVPKFKSRKHYRQSYTTSSVPSQARITTRHAIKLAKLGHVKAHLSSKLTGKIKQVPITLEPTGKYYASFNVQCESQTLRKTGPRLESMSVLTICLIYRTKINMILSAMIKLYLIRNITGKRNLNAAGVWLK